MVNYRQVEMSDKELGVYDKYVVARKGDESGKHDDCFYFVLDTTHDRFAKYALMMYAIACREEYPRLSCDLLDMVFKDAD
jgi:hypothetical protein